MMIDIPIYVINLKKNTDRLENINNIMNKYNLKYKKFNAIYGKEMTNDEINKNVNNFCKTILCNKGIVGCAMSHITLWKQLINDNKSDKYLILEDDINDIDIMQLNNLINYINNNNLEFNYINLYCGGPFCKKSLKKEIIINNNLKLNESIFFFGTVGYIINKNGAKKLIDMINKYKIIYHIDFTISFYKLLNRDFIYYNTNYNLIKLNDNLNLDSSISMKHTTILSTVLNYMGLQNISWYLNVPIFTIFLKYEISLYLCILIILLIINNKKIKNKYLNYFIIIEILIYTLN